METLGTWRLNVLGPPCLRAPDGRAVRCDGRALALLTLLAVEGAVPRARVADLLWPDSPEATARNNLVQLTRRLRATLGEDLVRGNDVLELATSVSADVRALLAGQLADTAPASGPLLAETTFDDAPDFTEWLLAWRERCDMLDARRLVDGCERLEREGDLAAAFDLNEHLLRVTPLSEDAWRRAMRLHFLRGDAAAALRAYDACETLLRDQLRTEPMPITRDLARDIRQASRAPEVTSPARPSFPRPALVGRADEWARLEDAWTAGKLIFVSGEPGVGKTRLLHDFAASKGAFLSLDGRPGDFGVPYGCATRNTRTLLARHPGVTLDARERAELARLFPEFADARAVPAPLESEAAVARFHETLLNVTRRAMTGLSVVVLDDLQYYDDATLEFGAFMMARAVPLGERGVARHLIGFRADQLSPKADALVRGLIDANVAVRIDLDPIGEQDVRTLLERLDVPRPERLAEQLARYTGGNPLFVLETVKYLRENDALDRGLPPRLPPPGQSGSVIEQRLARLSSRATLVARAAAVLQSDLSLDLVARTLDLPILEVAAAWEELEGAQLAHGERLAHDLIAQATLTSAPSAIVRALHRASARALEDTPASPARVAQHWLDGGDEAQAAPWLLRAGEVAVSNLRLHEAGAFFERAAASLERLGERDAAFEALERRARALQTSQDRAARQAALDALFERASDARKSARAWHLQAELHVAYGEGEDAEEAARAGLTRLERANADDVTLRANLLADVGAALWAQERVAEAASVLEDATALLERSGDSVDLASNLSNLAVVLDHQDRHSEAAEVHRRACALLERLGSAPLLPVALANLGVCLAELGRAREALEALRRAESVTRGADGALQWDATHAMLIAQSHVDLGEYDLALSRYEEAFARPDGGGWQRPQLHTAFAELLLILGVLDEAERHARTAADWPNLPSTSRSRALVVLARVLAARGLAAEDTFLAAERALEGNPRPLPRVRCLLARGPHEAPDRALARARQALELSRAHELGGYEITAHTRVAQALARASRASEAARHAREAADLLASREPSDVTRGEVLRTCSSVLAALGDPAAEDAAIAARRWLDGTLARLPSAYRAAFAARHAPTAPPSGRTR